MLKNCKIIGEDISYADYSRQPDGVKRGDKGFIMSRSELVTFVLCPAKYIEGGEVEDEDNKATTWGKLAECLAMSPADFDAKFAVEPKMYPCKSTGADPRTEKPWTYKAQHCNDWKEARTKDGFTVISQSVLADAKLAVKNLLTNKDIAALIECSRKQVHVSGFWLDKETGLVIPLRVLLDLVPDNTHPVFGKWLVDSKTARNGNPDFWARVCDDSGYDVQAALHHDLYVAAAKEDRTDWTFIVQENTPPYHVVNPMPSLTEEFIAWGRAKYEHALTLYARCLATGNWPSYSTSGRMVMFGLQKISPENLWTYRQMAGQGSLTTADKYPVPPPEYKTDDIAT